MRNVSLRHDAVFSLNFYLVAQNPPAHRSVFAEYLSGTERKFYEILSRFMESEGFVTGTSPNFRTFSFSMEYLIDSKDEKRIVRLYSEYGKLGIELKLHNGDCYNSYINSLPEGIKQIFRKESGCRFCREPCKTRLYRTFEGVKYTDCGYVNWFNISDFNPDYAEYYKQLILLETKAVKTKARSKGIKINI